MRVMFIPEPNDGLTYQQRFFRDMRVFCRTPGGKLILKLRKYCRRCLRRRFYWHWL